MSKELQKLLDGFRGAEIRSSLAGIVGSQEAIRVLAAWQSVRVVWRKPKGKRPKATPDLWGWLWRGVSFDLDNLARASRVSPRAAYGHLRALHVMRVVYPDGSISSAAQGLVTGFVERNLAQHAVAPAPREPFKPGDKAHEHDPTGPIRLECPTCKAKPFHACTRPKGEKYKGAKYHSARRKLAEGKKKQ